MASVLVMAVVASLVVPARAVAVVESTSVIGLAGLQSSPVAIEGGIAFQHNATDAAELDVWMKRDGEPAVSLAAGPGHQQEPHAHGRYVYFIDYREDLSSFAIDVVDCVTLARARVVAASSAIKRSPATSGTRLYWEQGAVGERVICSVPLDQNGNGVPDVLEGQPAALPVVAVAGGDCFSPAPGPHGLAYAERTGESNATIKHLAGYSGTPITLSADTGNRQPKIAAGGNLVVWNEANPARIAIRHMDTGVVSYASSGSGWVLHQTPATNGELVAWSAMSSTGVVQVFVRSADGSVSRPSPTTASQVSPAFGAGRMLWSDGRIVSGYTSPNIAVAILASSSQPPGSATVDRIAGKTRFSGAVRIAQEAFPGWVGVTDVVIASGDDAAAADPLAAAGLCWAYDAPMLLVSRDRTPSEVLLAIKEMASVNGRVTLRVVGGTASVPDERIQEILGYVGGNAVDVDRVIKKGSRYDLAAAIAVRMKEVASARPDKSLPGAVLIANGADSTKFFDALALSPISASVGAPVLLVSHGSVPDATTKAIKDLNPQKRIVGGGPNTVSEGVRNVVGGVRWSGTSRYETAIAIADNAVRERWLDDSRVGVAAKLPDALTGGAMIGGKHGVLVLSDGTKLTPATRAWLSARTERVEVAYAFGGQNSLSESVLDAIRNSLSE